MIRKTLCILFCLVLFGCVKTVIKVMPEYSSMNVKGASLGVIIINERLFVDNPADVNDDLGSGDPVKVFGDFFTGEFLDAARKDSKFANISLIEDYVSGNLKNITVPLNKEETMIVAVPKSDISAFSGSDSLPYVLIIDKIRMSREQKAPVMMMGPNGTMTSTGGSDDLVLSGKFVVWDNKAGQIVSYGKIEEKTGVFIMMTKNTWAQMVKEVSRKIFRGKPYGKSRSS